MFTQHCDVTQNSIELRTLIFYHFVLIFMLSELILQCVCVSDLILVIYRLYFIKVSSIKTHK